MQSEFTPNVELRTCCAKSSMFFGLVLREQTFKVRRPTSPGKRLGTIHCSSIKLMTSRVPMRWWDRAMLS
jgi:hypothetical protein